MSVPVSNAIKRYLARRSMHRTVCWPIAASKSAWMGQRRRRSRTRTLTTRRPMSAGAMPRRVVSTSGSSGMAHPSPDEYSRLRPASRRVTAWRLLDLRFFVRNVLARDRIEFLGLQLVGMQPFVLRGRIEVPGSGRGDQFDLIAHGNCSLNLDALGAEVGNDHVHTALL